MQSLTSTTPNRRQFIKTFAQGTTACLISGVLQEHRVVADIGVELASSTGSLRLKVSDYPTLNQPNGSVRISVNPLRSNHQPEGTFHPILINRLPSNELITLSAECTHASCAVRTFSNTSNAHICPCHGSRFAIDGRRLAGPAPFGLDTYASELLEGNILEIKVPRLGFNVNGCLEQSETNTRLKLEFPARRSVSYRALRKPDSNAEWIPTDYSDALEGPMREGTILGDDSIRSIYVETNEDSAFFAIEVLYQEV